jgi:DNA-binding NarL/FixJ family response regulator
LPGPAAAGSLELWVQTTGGKADEAQSCRSNAGIAEELTLTVGAVEKHIANILMKLRLPPSESDHRRVLAVLAYLQEES